MSTINDQGYLLRDQYNTAAKLDARVTLHARFSANHDGWHRWMFEQLAIAPDSRVLELGCGPAYLWQHNLDRIPTGWTITLSDFSAGMLDAARQTLGEHHERFRFAEIDAQAIPLPDASLDVVIANHMLYHVPDRPRALAEIRRVLQPGGRLYAATNGRAHLGELHALSKQIDPPISTWGGSPNMFQLESSAELEPLFDPVELRRYDDHLHVTEAEPLIAFVESMSPQPLSPAQRAALQARIEPHIARDGAIRISKDSGLFIATRAAD